MTDEELVKIYCDAFKKKNPLHDCGPLSLSHAALRAVYNAGQKELREALGKIKLMTAYSHGMGDAVNVATSALAQTKDQNEN